MGLDMFLYKKTYIGANYEHNQITGTLDLYIKLPIELNNVSEIKEEVAYWRKANHIHKWFVDNCQDGNDDCGEYRVTLQQLRTLVGICKRVLSAKEAEETNKYTYDNNAAKNIDDYGNLTTTMDSTKIAEELLPTQSGFFFGGTDIDEWYYEDIKSTIKQIEPVIANVSDDDFDIRFYYHSSW